LNVAGCARDEKKYEDIKLECQGNGNYYPNQYSNDGTLYCVDEDGFRDGTDNCLKYQLKTGD